MIDCENDKTLNRIWWQQTVEYADHDTYVHTWSPHLHVSKLRSLLKVRACIKGAESPRGTLCKHHSVEFPINGWSCGEFV